MKPILRSLLIFIRQITMDYVFLVVLLAPVLSGLLFRFGIPYVENQLCNYFTTSVILTKYYLLFDIMLCLLPSYMLCFASAMTMLTERDENMTGYIAVTPIGKSGYIISRLIFPAIMSIPYSVLIIGLFSLTKWNYLTLLKISIMMSILNIAVSLFIFSFSRNRVEGMAMAKMSGVLFLGLVIPFFIFSNIQYFIAFLPSFWIAKLSIEEKGLYFFIGIIESFIWIWILNKRFQRRLY